MALESREPLNAGLICLAAVQANADASAIWVTVVVVVVIVVVIAAIATNSVARAVAIVNSSWQGVIMVNVFMVMAVFITRISIFRAGRYIYDWCWGHIDGLWRYVAVVHRHEFGSALLGRGTRPNLPTNRLRHLTR